MKHLDLFSGIGGFALAARWVGWETVGFCEIDSYCQKVLRKHWPDVPIYEDVRDLQGEQIGSIDIISGGYPCQPFSVAGKRRGTDDDRHLWPEFARLIRDIRPRWVVGENVAGHIGMGLDEVLSDLEGWGYTWEAFVIPACAADAPHRRDRVWIIAYTRLPESSGWDEFTQGQQSSGGWIPRGKSAPLCGDVADPNGPRFQERPINTGMERSQAKGNKREALAFHGWWDIEPSVGRVANGIPRRVDRLRGLGNAIVPQVAEVIFRAIDESRS